MITMTELAKTGKESQQQLDNGLWVPAKFEKWEPWYQRFVDAWKVLRGEAKAVVWE